MSLIGALNIGQSALAVHQAAIQTTGNNISNAGNADYTRQAVGLSASKDQQIGPTLFVGGGVQLDSIRRQIDDALQGRLRGAVSDNQSAQEQQQWLGQVESVFNELSDSDLSTQLSTFFNGWSNLASKPADVGLRQVVIQNGQAIANWLHDVRGQLDGLSQTINNRLPALVNQADELTNQIATLNDQIATSEGGGTGGVANNLRDQRDAVIKQLSQLMDVQTVPQSNGMVDVFVGSEPLVLGNTSRGLKLVSTTAADGSPTSEVRFKANDGTVSLKTGQIGGLLSARKTVDDTNKQVDGIANSLIFELNKIHSSGQGLEGFSTVTGSNTVDDPTVALNDPKTGLANVPTNGSFVVHVKDKATGLVTSTLVQVDLDGKNANDTTLNGLTTKLGNIAGVNASVNAGQLTVAADSAAVEISFSQDSSGTLASLGINSFFTGKDARDIGVSATIVGNPNLLAAAKNGAVGDNQTARLIAGLESTPIGSLQGQSLKDRYQSLTGQIATQSASAKNSATATQGVLDTLTAQREAVSGVSLDEEAVNLIREQRAFQGAARLITTVNELMDTVMNMVR